MHAVCVWQIAAICTKNQSQMKEFAMCQNKIWLSCHIIIRTLTVKPKSWSIWVNRWVEAKNAVWYKSPQRKHVKSLCNFADNEKWVGALW